MNTVTVTVGVVTATHAWAHSIAIEPWIDDYHTAIAQLSKQVADDVFSGKPEVQE